MNINRGRHEGVRATPGFERSQERSERFLYEVYGRRQNRPELKDFLELIEGEGSDFRKAKFKSEWRRDERSIQALKAGMEKTGEIAGVALERFLGVEIENSDWFNASVFTTTDFDDIRNGVDAVLEWEAKEGESPYRLAVDFTTAESTDVVSSKLGRSRRGVQVERYISDFDIEEPVKRLSNLPRVILGIDKALLKEVAVAGLEKKKVRQVPHPDPDIVGILDIEDVERNAYTEHPLQIILLEQAKLQLGLLVREEAARIIKKLTDVRVELSDDIEKDLLRYVHAVDDEDAVVGVIDSIFRANDPTLNKVIKGRDIEKWKNWSGCYAMVSEQLSDVKESTKIRPHEVRALSNKSSLNSNLRNGVMDLSAKVA